MMRLAWLIDGRWVGDYGFFASQAWCFCPQPWICREIQFISGLKQHSAQTSASMATILSALRMAGVWIMRKNLSSAVQLERSCVIRAERGLMAGVNRQSSCSYFRSLAGLTASVGRQLLTAGANVHYFLRFAYLPSRSRLILPSRLAKSSMRRSTTLSTMPFLPAAIFLVASVSSGRKGQVASSFSATIFLFLRFSSITFSRRLQSGSRSNRSLFNSFHRDASGSFFCSS